MKYDYVVYGRQLRSEMMAHYKPFKGFEPFYFRLGSIEMAPVFIVHNPIHGSEVTVMSMGRRGYRQWALNEMEMRKNIRFPDVRGSDRVIVITCDRKFILDKRWDLASGWVFDAIALHIFWKEISPHDNDIPTRCTRAMACIASYPALSDMSEWIVEQKYGLLTLAFARSKEALEKEELKQLKQRYYYFKHPPENIERKLGSYLGKEIIPVALAFLISNVDIEHNRFKALADISPDELNAIFIKATVGHSERSIVRQTKAFLVAINRAISKKISENPDLYKLDLPDDTEDLLEEIPEEE